MNYKCPNCNGEFNEWDTKEYGSVDERDVCPFCGLERGKYSPPFNTTYYGYYNLKLPPTSTICPICGADQSKGEMCCLTIHCCDEDRKHGGAGVAHVSCPCPRCRVMV